MILESEKSSQGIWIYTIVKINLWRNIWIAWVGWFSRYSDWIRAGCSGIESRLGQDFPFVRTGPGVHLASCTMGNGSFPRVEATEAWGRPPHPHLVPKVLEKSRALPLLTLMACLAYKKRWKPAYIGCFNSTKLFVKSYRPVQCKNKNESEHTHIRILWAD